MVYRAFLVNVVAVELFAESFGVRLRLLFFFAIIEVGIVSFSL